jgi:hypothetical protein
VSNSPRLRPSRGDTVHRFAFVVEDVLAAIIVPVDGPGSVFVESFTNKIGTVEAAKADIEDLETLRI